MHTTILIYMELHSSKGKVPYRLLNVTPAHEHSLMHTTVEKINLPHVAHLLVAGFRPDCEHTKVSACGQLEEVLDGLRLLLQ